MLAVRFGLRVQEVVSTMHPYLTWGEGIKLTGQTFTKDVAKLYCCAWWAAERPVQRARTTVARLSVRSRLCTLYRCEWKTDGALDPLILSDFFGKGLGEHDVDPQRPRYGVRAGSDFPRRIRARIGIAAS